LIGKILLLSCLAAIVPALQAVYSLSGVVEDETRQAVSGVQVTLHSGTTVERTTTNDLGQFHFDSVLPGSALLDFDKSGFFRLNSYAVTMNTEPTEITVTLNHEYEIRSQVDVVSTAHEVIPEQASHEEELVAHEIREVPVPSSHTLQNSLQTIPAVVQDNTGLLHVAGGRVEDTLYTLDGFQLNNPATGQFGARVNVDAVRSASVSTGRYDSQFANAGSGVLALQTDTGDDRWRFGTTNFPPSLGFQRTVHLGNWFPRANFSGPIQKGRLWFSDGVSLQHDFSLVKELPPGGDVSESWSGDNLFRAQYKATSAQALQGNLLYNDSVSTRIGLGPFSPASTTTDLHTHLYLLSAKDQITISRGLIEIGVASDKSYLQRLPQGSQTYVLTPTGPQGNYFESVLQNSARRQGRADLTLLGRQWHGGHDLRAGINADGTSMDQTTNRHAVEIRQQSGALVRSTSFVGTPSVSVSEVRAGAYVQDAWKVAQTVLIQSSLRLDRNDFIGRVLVQPRLVVNWTPQNTEKFSFGWGLYDEPVYLSLIGQSRDQQRIDLLGTTPATPIITSFSLTPGLREPYFETISAEWEKAWTPEMLSGIHFIERAQRKGLVYENVSADAFRQDLLLDNNRRDRYRSIDVSFRRSLHDAGDLMVDYIYSRARSNKIVDYALEDLVLTREAPGPLPWDVPNRLISHGALQTNIWKVLFSYFAEYHTGFPFSAVNSQYQVVGVPNGFRYPAYFNLSIGAEKRFPFHGYQWAVRLSVINATGHHNFNSVINNVDAPNFLTFSGGQSRAFTARLRFVGRR
jgi:Carboxypeptidase regulatory-like domain